MFGNETTDGTTARSCAGADADALARAIEINEAHERLAPLGGGRFEVLCGDVRWFARRRRDY